MSVQLFVCPSAKPLNSLKLSSFIILHSSFLHFVTFKLFNLFENNVPQNQCYQWNVPIMTLASWDNFWVKLTCKKYVKGCLEVQGVPKKLALGYLTILISLDLLPSRLSEWTNNNPTWSHKVQTIFTKDVALICMSACLGGDNLLLSFIIIVRTLVSTNKELTSRTRPTR